MPSFKTARRRAIKGVGALALAVAAMTTATSTAVAAPVSATGCEYLNTWWSEAQVQVDNCPGTGSSWVWLYNNNPESRYKLEVWYDNGFDYFEVNPRQAASRVHYTQDVKAIKIIYPGGLFGHSSSKYIQIKY
ncbi:hypothetical protein [Streptomyces sp. NPDC047706]|uniref:hypothetical protein n=1 Tax=Streptomyces sp. NPDC047706 TaxID=3365486 RepID=UPI00372116AB